MAKHGGAWKVAYADFITAMMALFMVLWILGTEQELLEQMQEYFRNPPSPWDRQSGKFLLDMGEFSGMTKEGLEEEAFFNDMDASTMKGIIENLYRMMKIDVAEGEVPPVEIVLTSDGLRMIFFNRPDSPMFEPEKVALTEWGDFLIQNLAWLLSRYAFEVVIEGHSGPVKVESPDPSGQPEYGPWERSVDQANLVRRMLEFYAGGEVGINRVTGFGNKQPLEAGELNGRTHQRITISLSMAKPEVPPAPTSEPPVEAN